MMQSTTIKVPSGCQYLHLEDWDNPFVVYLHSENERALYKELRKKSTSQAELFSLLDDNKLKAHDIYL